MVVMLLVVVVQVWAMTNGQVLCMDVRFTDWFGKDLSEIGGHPFASLVVEQVCVCVCVCTLRLCVCVCVHEALAVCKPVRSSWPRSWSPAAHPALCPASQVHYVGPARALSHMSCVCVHVG